MVKIKQTALSFLIVFILSSVIFSFVVARPKSLSGFDGEALRQTAASQVGNAGGEKYWKWYGFDSRSDWCACFVSWCLSRCYDSYPKSASCTEFVRWFKNIRRFYSPNTKPLPGMIVFFDWDGDRSPDHMGIVDRLSGSVLYTIEGNNNDKCLEASYDLDSPLILGYGAVWD